MKTTLSIVIAVFISSSPAMGIDLASPDYYIGRDDGKAEGLQQGREEGEAVGREAGIQQGRGVGQIEGREETKGKVADALGMDGGGGKAYQYSGIPGKWTGPPKKHGYQPRLKKDTGPTPQYTLDHLPLGANSDEALWVKMKDGRLMMVDPRETQRLKK